MAIEHDRLVDILADAHVAEVIVQNEPASHKDSLLNHYYSQIFEIHGVQEVDFRSDMEILGRDAEQLHHLYEKVLDRLKERDSSMKK